MPSGFWRRSTGSLRSWPSAATPIRSGSGGPGRSGSWPGRLKLCGCCSSTNTTTPITGTIPPKLADPDRSASQEEPRETEPSSTCEHEPASEPEFAPASRRRQVSPSPAPRTIRRRSTSRRSSRMIISRCRWRCRRSSTRRRHGRGWSCTSTSPRPRWVPVIRWCGRKTAARSPSMSWRSFCAVANVRSGSSRCWTRPR